MRESKMALQQSTGASIEPNASLREWWGVVTTLLLAAIFIEAVFAGAMLSGVDWARTAHRLTAAILIASTLIAALAAIVSLRRLAHGLRLGLALLSLAASIFLQAAIGALSTKGANLLWVHVPLGVALFGLAARATTTARKIGRP
jgi:hypothetical protein